MRTHIYFAGYTTFEGYPVEPSVTLDLSERELETLQLVVETGHGALSVRRCEREGRTIRETLTIVPARHITRVEAVLSEQTEPEPKTYLDVNNPPPDVELPF